MESLSHFITVILIALSGILGLSAHKESQVVAPKVLPTRGSTSSSTISIQKYKSTGDEYIGTNVLFSTLNIPKEVSIQTLSNGDILISEDKLGQRIVMRNIPKENSLTSTASKAQLFGELECETGSAEYSLTSEGIAKCNASSTGYVVPDPELGKINESYKGDLYAYAGMMEDLEIYIIDLGKSYEAVYINKGGPYGEQCANEETKSPECSGAYQYLDDYFNQILQSLRFL